MAQAQKKLREGSHLPSEGWSVWKKAMVPEGNGGYTENRKPGQSGFIWKSIKEDINLAELCGIYEWRAIRQYQSPRVVYVGSTCTRRGNYEPLQSRILGYCWHGNHKAALINDTLTKGYTLEVRYKQTFNEADARQQENDLLDVYDYAWNKRCNGGINGIRYIL